jgi:hypothetical protein
MTDEQVKQVVTAYQARLAREGHRPVQVDFDRTTASAPKSRQLEHVAWMCPEILAALEAGDRDKAMRWLGFAQGVLWAQGVYAVAELREQNRATSPFER